MIIMDDHNIMEGSVGPWQALGNRSDNPSGPSPFGLPGGIFLFFANHNLRLGVPTGLVGQVALGHDDFDLFFENYNL